MPAIQPAAAMVKRGFDAYLSAHNLAPNTIHIYHFTVEQYLHCYPRLTLILNTAKQTFVRFRW